jgi:structural maintenance of chromosome 3 (chondroitin sulfate proteoglycan 6)
MKVKEASAKEEKDALMSELQAQTKEKTKLEFTLKDLRDEVAGDSNSKDRAEQELNKLKITIREKEKELEGIKPAYDEMRRKEDECTRELSLKEQKRKELYAKQGRGSQFTSKAQRDEWIQKELKSLNKQIKDKTEQIDKLSDDLKKDSKKKTELEKKIDELTGRL